MLPNKAFNAEAIHEKPEADEAIPEAVGKLFSETTLK
jgi:hypothetical protein